MREERMEGSEEKKNYLSKEKGITEGTCSM
jgi:hypothetical protein